MGRSSPATRNPVDLTLALSLWEYLPFTSDPRPASEILVIANGPEVIRGTLAAASLT